MWNLGSGFAQGVYENHRGLDEKREYEELSKQRELARQRTQQIMDKDKLEMQEIKNKLYLQNIEIQKTLATAEADRGRKDLVNFVETIQKNKGKNVTIEDEIVSPDKLPEGFDPKNYTQNEDGTYTRKIAKYGKSEDILKGEENMNERWVYNQDGSRWINNVLNTVDNPVTSVTYDPQQDEINFRLRDGSYISYPPSIVYAATGMDKLGSLSERNLIEKQRADFIADQKVIEAKLKNDKTQMEIRTGDIEANAKQATANAAVMNANTHQFEAMSNAQLKKRELDMREQGTYTSGSIKDQAKLKETEQLNNLREKANNSKDKDFYKIYKSSPKLMEQDLMKNGDMRKNLSEATTAALIVKEMEKFEAKAEVLMKLQNATTIDDKIKGEVAKYFPGLTDDDWNDRAKLMSYLTTQAKQLAANQIKLLSGAAFTTEEFKNQVNDYLKGIDNLQSVDSWKESLASLKNAWRTNTGKYNGMLTGAQQRFLSGLIQSSEEETRTLMNTIEESGRVGYLTDSLEEMKNKSPEEQKAWYNGLNPKMKATLKNMRKKDAE